MDSWDWGKNDEVLLPIQITTLPFIKQVSCGGNFTVCVDYDGFVWSFGQNNYGQLGTGNKTNFNVPQQIQNIPPVLSVDCGLQHTLFITKDLDLWSCGSNEHGQLCLENQEDQSTPQQTFFSNIKRISIGAYHSLFQNINGEIYSCGYNKSGACGLGHFKHPQITPSLIPNLPPNIVQMVCGYYFSLFLDSEGNVFSVGDNYFGQLGREYGKTLSLYSNNSKNTLGKNTKNTSHSNHFCCIS